MHVNIQHDNGWHLTQRLCGCQNVTPVWPICDPNTLSGCVSHAIIALSRLRQRPLHPPSLAASETSQCPANVKATSQPALVVCARAVHVRYQQITTESQPHGALTAEYYYLINLNPLINRASVCVRCVLCLSAFAAEGPQQHHQYNWCEAQQLDKCMCSSVSGCMTP